MLISSIRQRAEKRAQSTQTTDAIRPVRLTTTGPLPVTPVVSTTRSQAFQLCILNPALVLSVEERKVLIGALSILYRGRVLPGPGGFYKINDLFLHPSEQWRVLCHATSTNEVHS